MSQSGLVSIILPVYNAEKFISDTINSLTKQSYKNVEIIIIDDGSVDNSRTICELFADKDDRIQYYRQENQGICKSRNMGLEFSHGEYICFCDHDDIYEPYFIEVVKIQIEKQNVDVVCAGYREISIIGDEIRKEELRMPITEDIWNKSNVFDHYLGYQHIFTTVWNCMYRRSSIINIRFNENLKYGGEDVLFNLELLHQDCSIGKVKKIVYNHYKRYGQSASSKLNDNRITSLLFCLKKETEIIMEAHQTDKADYITKSEAYYLGGILSLAIRTKNAHKVKTVLKGLEDSSEYKWTFLYRRTQIGIKYDMIYYLFCHRFYVLAELFATIKMQLESG